MTTTCAKESQRGLSLERVARQKQLDSLQLLEMLAMWTLGSLGCCQLVLQSAKEFILICLRQGFFREAIRARGPLIIYC